MILEHPKVWEWLHAAAKSSSAMMLGPSKRGRQQSQQIRSYDQCRVLSPHFHQPIKVEPGSYYPQPHLRSNTCCGVEAGISQEEILGDYCDNARDWRGRQTPAHAQSDQHIEAPKAKKNNGGVENHQQHILALRNPPSSQEDHKDHKDNLQEQAVAEEEALELDTAESSQRATSLGCTDASLGDSSNIDLPMLPEAVFDIFVGMYNLPEPGDEWAGGEGRRPGMYVEDLDAAEAEEMEGRDAKEEWDGMTGMTEMDRSSMSLHRVRFNAGNDAQRRGLGGNNAKVNGVVADAVEGEIGGHNAEMYGIVDEDGPLHKRQQLPVVGAWLTGQINDNPKRWLLVPAGGRRITCSRGHNLRCAWL